MRSLEEWSKTVRPETARGFEAIRYRSYEASAALITGLARRSAQWRVCLLLTEAACRAPWQQVLEAAIDGGVDCIQIREKELSDDTLLQRVRKTISIARPRGVSVVVNDRVDIALAADADGVHLGQGELDQPCVSLCLCHVQSSHNLPMAFSLVLLKPVHACSIELSIP